MAALIKCYRFPELICLAHFPLAPESEVKVPQQKFLDLKGAFKETKIFCMQQLPILCWLLLTTPLRNYLFNLKTIPLHPNISNINTEKIRFFCVTV